MWNENAGGTVSRKRYNPDMPPPKKGGERKPPPPGDWPPDGGPQPNDAGGGPATEMAKPVKFGGTGVTITGQPIGAAQVGGDPGRRFDTSGIPAATVNAPPASTGAANVPVNLGSLIRFGQTQMYGPNGAPLQAAPNAPMPQGAPVSPQMIAAARAGQNVANTQAGAPVSYRRAPAAYQQQRPVSFAAPQNGVPMSYAQQRPYVPAFRRY